MLVHTGQHYDEKMSAVFFHELKMPEPDLHLGVGSGSHAAQTARVMAAFEGVCIEHKPELVVVAGDVNSTLACALTATKLHIPVAHLESGLRSFDREMPEEINRILTDHIADILLVTEASGEENLVREGISSEKIHFVGNTMIDSLRAHLDRAVAGKPWEGFGLEAKGYKLATLHRPANVDDGASLTEILGALEEIGEGGAVLFPAHPRTRKQIEDQGIGLKNIRMVEPLGYLDFLGLMAEAKVVLTDSGGIQEETTALRVPCITIRENTERPVTIEEGTNRLAGTSRDAILRAYREIEMEDRVGSMPYLWDGKAAGRCVDVFDGWLGERGVGVDG